MSRVVVSSIERAVPLARDLVAVLDGPERPLAEEFSRMAEAYALEAPSDEGSFRREMNRLVELLARRSARAMPLAALGRALLADLGGDVRERESLVREFETKVALLGLL